MVEIDPYESTYIKHALHNYRIEQPFVFDEFLKDYKIPLFLNKFFSKYQNNKTTNHQRIANLLIIYFNVFNRPTAIKLLFLFVKPVYHSYLKTYLFHLNLLDDSMDSSLLGNIPIDSILLDKITDPLQNPLASDWLD